jgi:hypothetical protein
VTLRREEAQTTGRHARVSFNVSVVCCDRAKCKRAAFANIGEGLSDDAAEELTEDGWIIGEHDYCPDHADAHRDNEGTDEVKP